MHACAGGQAHRAAVAGRDGAVGPHPAAVAIDDQLPGLPALRDVDGAVGKHPWHGLRALRARLGIHVAQAALRHGVLAARGVNLEAADVAAYGRRRLRPVGRQALRDIAAQAGAAGAVRVAAHQRHLCQRRSGRQALPQLLDDAGDGMAVVPAQGLPVRRAVADELDLGRAGRGRAQRMHGVQAAVVRLPVPVGLLRMLVKQRLRGLGGDVVLRQLDDDPVGVGVRLGGVAAWRSGGRLRGDAGRRRRVGRRACRRWACQDACQWARERQRGRFCSARVGRSRARGAAVGLVAARWLVERELGARRCPALGALHDDGLAGVGIQPARHAAPRGIAWRARRGAHGDGGLRHGPVLFDGRAAQRQ
ncbi:Uncharacterised protein [Bordetella pertussis]|nr:Uncharacterised protein [Bordetella pertussis]CFW90570.1 Uncharacterised protein [Bordetella pertussis]